MTGDSVLKNAKWNEKVSFAGSGGDSKWLDMGDTASKFANRFSLHRLGLSGF